MASWYMEFISLFWIKTSFLGMVLQTFYASFNIIISLGEKV